MARTGILAEGKTKIIWQIGENPNFVDIQSKNDLTAGDGKKRIEIAGMGEIANHTTCNVFRFLEICGVKTHFIAETDSDAFRAKKCRMIPIEVVCRRMADGSYLKRNPDVKKGEIFPKLAVEMFYKNDELHDPLINTEKKCDCPECGKPDNHLWHLRNAKDNIFMEWIKPICDNENVKKMKDKAKFVFLLLEKSFANLGVDLWDLKLEFGYSAENNELILADVVDNSSWRITVCGVNFDKQVFRDGVDNSEYLKSNYKIVEGFTKTFFDYTKTNPLVYANLMMEIEEKV